VGPGVVAVSGGQFPDGAIDIGLAPELRAAIVEQVEVMGIVAFHVDDLELGVLVIEIGVVGFFFIGSRQVELAGEEEARI